MEEMPLGRAFTLLEPGPVIWVVTDDGTRANVMTISWTMVLDFDARFAICTGPWNSSYAALEEQRDCVIAIPPAEMIDTVLGVGTCSGKVVDKIARFGLRTQPARHVRPPLLADCIAAIECRVVDIVEAHSILVLQGVAAWTNPALSGARMLHAVGDGTFIADGERFDRRAQMASKLPPGI